jgi:hypothetical protein
MGPMNIHRLRGNWKAMSAALGVGIFVTMGAATLAHPTMEPGTTSDSWTAATLRTPPPMIPATSFAFPTHTADPCEWAAPHARAHGVC